MKRISRRRLFLEAFTQGLDHGARAAGFAFRTIEELDRLAWPDAAALVPLLRSESGLAIAEGRVWQRREGGPELIAELNPLELWLAQAADGQRTLETLHADAPATPSTAELQAAFVRLVRLQVLVPETPPPETL